jgi:hypothetical protein
VSDSQDCFIIEDPKNNNNNSNNSHKNINILNQHSSLIGYNIKKEDLESEKVRNCSSRSFEKKSFLQNTLNFLENDDSSNDCDLFRIEELDSSNEEDIGINHNEMKDIKNINEIDDDDSQRDSQSNYFSFLFPET